jgi:hypothetical protein
MRKSSQGGVALFSLSWASTVQADGLAGRNTEVKESTELSTTSLRVLPLGFRASTTDHIESRLNRIYELPDSPLHWESAEIIEMKAAQAE